MYIVDAKEKVFDVFVKISVFVSFALSAIGHGVDLFKKQVKRDLAFCLHCYGVIAWALY